MQDLTGQENGKLGLTLELSPDVAEFLRRKKPERIDGDQMDFLPSEYLTPLGKPSTENGEAWDDVIPLPQEEASEEETEQQVTDDNEQVEEDGDGGSEVSSISYSAPESLPLVLVDVARLVGYEPTTQEELAQISSTIRAALYGDENVIVDRSPSNPQSDTNNDNEQKALAKEFDQRVTEMFETGAARHTDTEAKVTQISLDSTRFVAIEYPEFLCKLSSVTNGTNASTDVKVLNTARLWKRLIRTRSVIDVVNRILDLLVHNCSRSILWKQDMVVAILDLADREDRKLIEEEQADELMQWKTFKRKEQLEKLYTVRETFKHRIEEAKAKMKELEDNREESVKLELRRRRLIVMKKGLEHHTSALATGESGVGLEAFDFESTVFAFPSESPLEDDLFLGLARPDDNNIADDFYPDLANDEEDDLEGYAGDEGSISDGSNAQTEEQFVYEEKLVKDDIRNMQDVSTKKQRRRKASMKKRNNRLAEAAKEAEHKAKLEAAKAEEDRVRELCTTHHFKMQAAVVMSLEGKLKQVDNLLEALQEEEWAEEEEIEKKEAAKDSWLSTTDIESTSCDHGNYQLSLLDQILAMILGAYHPPADGSKTLKEHVQQLEEIHHSILEEWIEYFGRLPPFVPSSLEENRAVGHSAPQGRLDITNADKNIYVQKTENPSSLRESLGIIDNEGDDWEGDDWEAATDDEDNVVHQRNHSPTKSSPANGVDNQEKSPPQKVYGLRPGGHLE